MPYILISAIGFLLYFKSLFFDFTYLDDNALILNNLPFLQNFSNVFHAFTRDVFNILDGSAAYYRPLLTVSFMPDAAIGGALPIMYHLTNIIIHILAACLVFKLLTKLKYPKTLSLLLALIFTVHPVLTQAVSWIPGRNDSLLTVFVLASFIFLVNFVEKRTFWPIIWSVIFFAAALFTKETALVLPLLFLFYLWIRGCLDKFTFLKFGAGWLMTLLAWLFLRHLALQNPLPLSAMGEASSVLMNLPAGIQLFGKVFFPFNLSVMPIIQDTAFFWGMLAIIPTTLLIIFQINDKSLSKKNNYTMLFGLLWFLVFLMPTFAVPDSSTATNFFEYRLYLPIIGLLIFLAESRLGRQFNKPFGNWLLPIWVFVIIIFFGLTFTNENNFSDKFAFWESAVAASPDSPLAQRNLGAMYYLDGNYNMAETYFNNAVALNYYEPMVHNNLGLIYAGRGLFSKAEAEYLAELSFNPGYDSAHYNLGLLYYQTNRFKGAAKEWEKTLEINPNYQDARQALNNLKNNYDISRQN